MYLVLWRGPDEVRRNRERGHEQEDDLFEDAEGAGTSLAGRKLMDGKSG